MLKKITSKDFIVLVILSILAFAIRICYFRNLNGDMEHYLIPWIEKINSLGKIRSLKYVIGDYNTPYIFILTMLSYLPLKNEAHYVYAIKFVSVLYDYILAISSMLLVYRITKNYKKSIITYVVILMLPTVMLNSSMWGQCDSIYTSFVIMSIVCLVENKHKLAMLFLGIAFSFKLQTVLILPLWGFVLLSKNGKKPKCWDMFIFIITFLAMGLPSLIMGKSFIDTYNVYFLQTRTTQRSFHIKLL